MSATQGCSDVDCNAVSPARIERQPVLTLQEHGPWGSPYDAAQGPAFRLYEDGRLLFTAGDGEAARVMQADLTPDEVYALLDAARDVLDPMPAHTDLAGGASDQAQTSITLTHDNRTCCTPRGWASATRSVPTSLPTGPRGPRRRI
jgi:hypothetical protein